MTTITIREAKPADYGRWHELWQGYLSFYKEALPDKITQVTWERLLSGSAGMTCLIAADEEDRPQGFAHIIVHVSTWAEAPYCYLEDLFVDPELRGTGAGRALIGEIYRRADEQGWPYVYWKTQENNYQARTLYDRVGAKEGFLIYSRP